MDSMQFQKLTARVIELEQEVNRLTDLNHQAANLIDRLQLALDNATKLAQKVSDKWGESIKARECPVDANGWPILEPITIMPAKFGSEI